MALDEQLRQLADKVPAPPAGDADAVFRRGVRRRRVRQGASVVAVVAVLGVGALTLVDGPTLPDIADRPPAPAPTEQGVDRPDQEPEGAPADPDRIGCEPDGCEVWRRPLSGMPPTPQWVAGRPVVIDDEQLVGLDVETGAVRWQVPIGDELRAREGGSVDLSLGRVALTGNDELVVLANTQGVQLVTQAGRTRWARPLPAEGAHLLWVHVTETAVVIVHEAPPVLADAEEVESGEPFPLAVTITVLDAGDGQLRWSDETTHRVFPLPTLVDREGLLLVQGDDGAFAALDLDDGEPHYALPGGADLTPEHTGQILTLRDLDGATADTTRLFDASDGTLRAELQGSARSLLDIGDRTIVLLASAATDGGSREAVAVDPDGSIAWRHPVDPAGSCCPSILDLDDARIRISDGPGTSALVVDASDGSVQSDDPLGAVLSDAVGEQHQLGRRLLLERPAQHDAPGYILRNSAGRSLQLSGQATPGPTPGTSPSPDIVLLANPRELVAVRFP